MADAMADAMADGRCAMRCDVCMWLCMCVVVRVLRPACGLVLEREAAHSARFLAFGECGVTVSVISARGEERVGKLRE